MKNKPERTIYHDFGKQKFGLQMMSSGKRRVYISTVQTLGGFLARTKQGIKNWRSWFIYDKRTKSVRLFKDKTMVLSNALGKGSKRGNYAVFRKYAGTRDQVISVTNSRYIKNKQGHCLTPEHMKNGDRVSLTWAKCHRLQLQKFTKEFGLARGYLSYAKRFKTLRKKVKATQLSQATAMAQSMQGRPEHEVVHAVPLIPVHHHFANYQFGKTCHAD